MKKLCEVDSPAVASEILSRLDEESISAEVTHSHSSTIFSHVGRIRSQATSIIWIRNAEDLPRAAEIHAEVSSVPLESKHCLRCGYDLEGHDGDGICPECGNEVTPIDEETVPCVACGEENPTNFETCWKCGKQTTGEGPEAADDTRSEIRPRCTECDAVLGLGARQCSDCGADVPSWAARSRKRSRSHVVTWWLLGILAFVLLIRLGASL